MFTINIETCFSADHQLVLPDGSKEPVHHHDWVVTVSVSSRELTGAGIVMDFGELKMMTDNIVSDFNNGRLEDVDYFQRNNSSAENVAQFIYTKLARQVPEGVSLDYVEVVEAPGSSAKFSK